MVDFRPIDAIAMHGIEAITLSEPMREGSPISYLYRGGGAILSMKLCAGVAGTVIFNPSIVIDDFHLGVKIGEVIRGASRQGGQSAAGVEAKKIYASFPAMSHVSADVEFGKG